MYTWTCQCDTGQQIPFFWKLSIDHNMVHYQIKNYEASNARSLQENLARLPANQSMRTIVAIISVFNKYNNIVNF